MDGLLPGGNMNAVERVGDTVRRNAGPWTPTVHRYLEHIARNGVTWAPHPLAIDGDREVLSFVVGAVPVYPLPGWVWADAVLIDGARRLRQLHEASVGFALDGAIWQSPVHEPVEVICHNDFAPHNLAFARGTIVGAIDFDMCSPGPRIWDIAYFATRAVPLTASPEPGAPDMTDARRRVQLILDAYYAVDVVAPDAAVADAAVLGAGAAATWEDVLKVAIQRLQSLAEFSVGKAAELRKPELRDHAAAYDIDAAYLLSLRRSIGDSA
ncbi:MAG TPA: phosphotransferase [Microbacteriaceae bacterium]